MGILRIITKSVVSRTMAYNSEKGLLYLWGMPYFFISNDSLANLQKSMIDTFGKEFKDTIFTLGKTHGHYATKFLLNKYGLLFKGDYKFFVEQSDLVGIGTVILNKSELDKKTHYVCNKNSPLSDSYLKLFGKQKAPVDHYLMGLSAGVSMALDGWDNVAFENKCISMGDEECEFIVTDKNDYQGDRKNFPEEPPELLNLIKKVDMNKITEKKTIGNSKLFSFKDGKLYIDKIEGLFTAQYVLISINEYMEGKHKQNYIDKLYECGEFQGKDISKKIKKSNTMISNTMINKNLDKLKPLGFGNFKISSLSTKKAIIIENTECPYARQYEKIFGRKKKKIDHYLSGILNGFLSELLNYKTKTEEISCFLQNGKKCIFKISSA